MKSNKNISYLLLFSTLVMAMTIAAAQKGGPQNFDNKDFSTLAAVPSWQLNEVDSLGVWQEQVVLHTDKEQLRPKDHLFFKAYVLTGPEQLRVSASDVLRVELLDENGLLLDSQYHKIQNGSSEGSFEIPKKTKSGNYYFRAYTRWMLNYGPENFATKKLSITNIKNHSPDFSNTPLNAEVFPEGGQMVAGLESKVIIDLQVIDQQNISVVNSKGEEVAKVQNFGNGMGSFVLTPKKGEAYRLKLNEAQSIKLPDVENIGYSLRVNNLKKDKVVVAVRASKQLKSQDLFLRGRVHGAALFEIKVDFDNSDSFTVDIPKGNMPNGILTLQLEDEFDQVWASRPVLITNNKINITVNDQRTEEGDKLVNIKVTDDNGLPVQIDLSVALGTVRYAQADTGYLNDTFENFRNQNFVNDLLVLTGQLPDEYALNKAIELPNEIKYNFQNGLDFYGKAYDLNNTLLPNTKIQMLLATDNDVLAKEVITNSEGLFQLNGLQIDGEVKIVFRMLADEAKEKFVKVVPFQFETPPLKHKGKIPVAETPLNSKQFLPKRQEAQFLVDDNIEKLVTLDGVTLLGEKLKIKKSPSVYNMEPSRVAFQDLKSPKTIPELFLGIPGVWVKGLGDINPSLILPRSAGVGPVLWVVDGLPLSQTPAEMGSTQLGEIMSMIPYIDVERIELLFGANAAIYGVRAAGGAILIYTRDGADDNYFNRKKAELTFSGFHKSISFDERQHGVSNTKKDKEDAFSTIYWNPKLATNGEGEATIVVPEMFSEIPLLLDLRTISQTGKRGSLKTLLRP